MLRLVSYYLKTKKMCKMQLKITFGNKICLVIRYSRTPWNINIYS